MDKHYTGKETLEHLKEAVRYNAFIERELNAFIGDSASAVDFGAGNGEFATRLRKRNKRILTVESDTTLRQDLAQKGFETFSSLADIPAATRIYSLNVLEHIKDDDAVPRIMFERTETNGRLFIYVPAFDLLTTSFDKEIGHIRRYRKTDLTLKIRRAGFQIERAEYVDCLGFICWLIMGRLPGNQSQLNPYIIQLFDRFIFPASRLLDRWLHPSFGKNLLVIAAKHA